GTVGPDGADRVPGLAPYPESEALGGRAPSLRPPLQCRTATSGAQVVPARGTPRARSPLRCPGTSVGVISWVVCCTSITRPRHEPGFVHPSGLVPYLTPDRVVGQALHVLREPLGVASLDGLHRPGVQSTSAILQKASVGHLVGERVLERILDVGEQT